MRREPSSKELEYRQKIECLKSERPEDWELEVTGLYVDALTFSRDTYGMDQYLADLQIEAAEFMLEAERHITIYKTDEAHMCVSVLCSRSLNIYSSLYKAPSLYAPETAESLAKIARVLFRCGNHLRGMDAFSLLMQYDRHTYSRQAAQAIKRYATEVSGSAYAAAMMYGKLMDEYQIDTRNN